jgi:hypothetical protein
MHRIRILFLEKTSCCEDCIPSFLVTAPVRSLLALSYREGEFLYPKTDLRCVRLT